MEGIIWSKRQLSRGFARGAGNAWDREDLSSLCSHSRVASGCSESTQCNCVGTQSGNILTCEGKQRARGRERVI